MRGTSLSLSFAATVLLARLLGADGYGLYAWATAWGIALQIVTAVGFDRLAIREVAAAIVTDDYETVRGVLRAGRRTVTGASLAVLAVVLGLGVAVFGRDQAVALALALVVLPVMGLTTLRQGTAQGLGHVVAGRIPEDLVRPVLLTGALLVAAVAGWSVNFEAALIIQATGLVVAFLVGNRILAHIMPAGVRDAEPRGATIEWVRKAAPLAVAGSTQVLLAQVATIMLGILATTTAVASYAVGTKIALLVGLPEFAINTAFLGVIASLNAKGDLERLRELASVVALVGLVGTALTALIPLLYPEWVLGIFGFNVEGGDVVVQLLCVAWIISAASGLNGSLLMMTGNMTPVVRSVAAALVLNVALNLVLIPSHGAVGAAWSWVITLAVWNAALVVQCRSALGFWALPSAAAPVIWGRLVVAARERSGNG